MNIPRNIEAYYQETGRAGRDGLPANALMIYGMSDAAMQRNFIDESNAPELQKRIEHQKLSALLGLCEAASCRRQILLGYFGDQAKACGNCDSCDNPPDTFDGTIAAQKALSSVYRTDQRFGVSYLVNLLLGMSDERMQRLRHDTLRVFGIGSEFNKTQWQGIFRQLVALNLLSVDADHGGLKITAAGEQFLRDKPALHLRKHAPPRKDKTSRIKCEAMPLANPADDALFDQLRSVRLLLAKEQSVPPYVIFHDKTLRDMARHKPQNTAELSAISGVGETKMKRYGAAFLNVINAFDTV